MSNNSGEGCNVSAEYLQNRKQAPLDATLPALAATPLIPGGAIFAAWNDLTATNYPGEAPHGDVAFSLIPTPILRHPLGH